MSPLSKVNDVAELLGCSVKTVMRRVKKGIIPAIQEGGPGTQYRFDIEKVIEAIQSKNVNTAVILSPHSAETKLSGPQPKWTRKHPTHE